MNRLPRPTVPQILQGLVGMFVAFALIFWGLPWIAKSSWTQIGHELARYSLGHMAIFAGLSIVCIYLYGFLFTSSLRGLSQARAMQLNVCATAVGNSLPGGGFLSVAALYMMTRSWGYSRKNVAGSILVTSAWSFVARCALPGVAFTWLLVQREHVPRSVEPLFLLGAVTGAAVVALMFVWLQYERPAIWLTRLARPILDWLGKRRGLSDDPEQVVLNLRARMRSVVGNRGMTMTLSQIAYFAVSYLLFWWCLHALGVNVPIAWSFAAFAIGRLMTVLPLTPGDLGVTEASTLAVLIGAGADSAASAAAIVVYTLFGTLLATPLGIIGWLVWWMGNRGKPAAPPEELA